ncbi:hypothetical protein cce_2058 [Crocosphaera subtropica ATCC 51142]|uniref:CHASE2 domain-containing protein n=1 Tax=Crocosphaera subtropica (strain ATCC 51142 / BH68) TaxID=43989 RepID=B1X1H9_CROS5|nr:CHASE2 domain-containing protein [Crocosphaera subtropica]ACB51408.1 hypothetical protein cce_2058 [Crocosphaera subtropica ATCC 51142]
MSKLVVLKLGKGNWQQGFSNVNVQVSEPNRPMSLQLSGSLPSDLELWDQYQQWRNLYEALSVNLRLRRYRSSMQPMIEFDSEEVTHISDGEFLYLCDQLEQQLNRWLSTESFSRIERQLRSHLNVGDEIRLIIETENQELRRFPWHLWHFFEDYPFVEVALSPAEYGQVSTASVQRTGKVRVLAILGNSQGIDVEKDRTILQQLPDGEVIFLVEPQRQDLDRWLWDEQGWDILFFAGHSFSQSQGMTGQLEINPQESLSLSQLRNALKTAIRHGLKLAIFNSCDGLGLAQQLADLHIPQTIVMRESVPDVVAQEFLTHFLRAFSGGKSFYCSVREARERLQGLEGLFPCASWLPVICQNPVETPPNWQKLRDKQANSSVISPSRPKVRGIVLASLAVTIVTMGFRWLGWLQSWELKAFDYFMVHRPQQEADNRLLIIGADEEDLNRYGYPLSDEVIDKLLTQLQSYQPSVIGMDIFRDQPVLTSNVAKSSPLSQTLAQSQNVVAICTFGESLAASVAPPESISPQQVGFVNLYDDRQPTQGGDDMVRRYLLSRSANPLEAMSRCTTPYSFAWQLAYRYLQNQDISVISQGEDWRFGKVLVQRLKNRSAGYQTLDERGNQLLINYKNTPQIAQHITVRDILDNNKHLNPAWIKDRVVLIGITAPSIPDRHDTPYGEIRGINIHAHVVSQLLSAAEGNNSTLFWWLPQWGDFLLTLFWSLIGGLIVYLHQPLYRVGFVVFSLLFMSGIYWFIFLQQGWLPLIPSALAFLGSVGIIVLIKNLKIGKYNSIKKG